MAGRLEWAPRYDLNRTHDMISRLKPSGLFRYCKTLRWLAGLTFYETDNGMTRGTI